jgi:hypothetical protein
MLPQMAPAELAPPPTETLSGADPVARPGPSPLEVEADAGSLDGPSSAAAVGTASLEPAERQTSMPSCTAAQLRRFIKSRPYVPMHELRRRFGINGAEDDVSAVNAGSGRVFVGLPMREGELLGELFRAGDVGYELSVDPCTPIVIGVYPMRPVPRA